MEWGFFFKWHRIHLQRGKEDTLHVHRQVHSFFFFVLKKLHSWSLNYIRMIDFNEWELWVKRKNWLNEIYIRMIRFSRPYLFWLLHLVKVTYEIYGVFCFIQSISVRASYVVKLFLFFDNVVKLFLKGTVCLYHETLI